MTADELYKHITSHMTAEEALMKLLTGHLREYDKLKFSQEGEEIHPVILISMATLDMGWNVAIPRHDDNPDAEIEGMIVGTNEYIDSVLDKKCESNESNISIDSDIAERISKTMNINAPKGTAVKLNMKDGEIFGGYDIDKKRALENLKPDTIYHIERTDIGDYETNVYLIEVPRISFNSVMFEKVNE